MTDLVIKNLHLFAQHWSEVADYTYMHAHMNYRNKEYEWFNLINMEVDILKNMY